MPSARRRTFEPLGIWRGKPAATSLVAFGRAVAFHVDWHAARRWRFHPALRDREGSNAGQHKQ